jgi:hypothetical protein
MPIAWLKTEGRLKTGPANFLLDGWNELFIKLSAVRVLCECLIEILSDSLGI